MKYNMVKKIKVYLGCLFVACIASTVQAEQLKLSLNQSVIHSSNAPSKITRKIRQENDGNLIMASFKDVIQYDGKLFSKLKHEGLNSYDAFDALEDTKGNIWIASTHKGLFRYDGKNFTNFTVKDGLRHNRTMALYQDKTGGVWIATQGGLSFIDEKSLSDKNIIFQNFTTEDGLTSNDISTILEDSTGKLWVGTRGTVSVYQPSMLSVSDKKTFSEITDNEGKPFTNVWSIIEDKQGNIWLSDERGLWRYKDNSFTHFSTTPRSAVLLEDTNGNIWFTQKNTLSYFDKEALLSESAKATQVYAGNEMFFGIAEDKAGHIWVGTLKGVFRYDGTFVTVYKDNLERE